MTQHATSMCSAEGFGVCVFFSVNSSGTYWLLLMIGFYHQVLYLWLTERNKLPDVLCLRLLSSCVNMFLFVSMQILTPYPKHAGLPYTGICTCIMILQTLPRMSRCPWLAARWSGVSSPRFITLMRAPLIMSMSTTLERPSRHAQCSGLNPWSSLRHKHREALQSDKISTWPVLDVTSWLEEMRKNLKPYTRFVGSIAYSYFNVTVTVQLFYTQYFNETLTAVVSSCVQVSTHHNQDCWCEHVLLTTIFFFFYQFR